MSRIIPLIVAIIGTYCAYQGWFQYGFWVNKGPGGGFLPVIIGVLCALLCIYEAIKNTDTSVRFERKHLFPIIATILLFFAINIVGMIAALGLFMIAWLFFLEKFTIYRSATLGICTTGVIYIVFKLFLHVPFPVGYLGI
ncbi:tripartite tricarboxylate transporter TctB family protein [Pseudalkalibacillus decolorationis]|uniref:tripartite tricarboxylate transporter TctB family protein n=1 Tax=Pseudalkalibacillus decolorationis TaxID=163879 RepID=UPI002148F8F3|nr:tripartite tricarboxylate transporter TctB family protein [Pseudalkalibacillus decolorationis]